MQKQPKTVTGSLSLCERQQPLESRFPAFAQNKKYPALLWISEARTFNLAVFLRQAMYLGTHVCLQVPANWGLCDRHRKGARKVGPWMWQGSDRTSDGLTYEFVLNEERKDLAFFLDIYEGMRRLQVSQEPFFSCYKKKKTGRRACGCCMHKQARFFSQTSALNPSTLVATWYLHWPCFHADADSELHFVWASACVWAGVGVCFDGTLSSLLMLRHK